MPKILLRFKPFLVKIIIFSRNLFKSFKKILTYFKSIYLRIIYPFQIKSYLKNDFRKLQLGSGDNLMEGWFNTDLYPKKGFIYLDVSKPLPIPSSSFDRIFSEHMIEHVSFQESYLFLKECHRILKPGGRIRIATPDLDHYLRLFNSEKSSLDEEYIDWISKDWLIRGGITFKNPSMFINLVMHSWGHEFIFDFDTFNSVLKEIGFKDVTRHVSQESFDVNFKNIERHGAFIGNQKMNSLETLNVEATK